MRVSYREMSRLRFRMVTGETRLIDWLSAPVVQRLLFILVFMLCPDFMRNR